MVEIDERAVGPQPKPELFAAHQLARTLHQHGEHLKGTLLQFQSRALLAKFSGAQVK